MNIRFIWDEAKRLSNIADHGFDFMDVPAVFSGSTMTFEDDRFDYDEQRFVTLGFLKEVAVSVVHTETESEIHVISFRKATRRESRLLHESI